MRSIRQGRISKLGQDTSSNVAANVVADHDYDRPINITIRHPLAPAIETESDSSEDLSPRVAETQRLKKDPKAMQLPSRTQTVEAELNIQRISFLYEPGPAFVPDELAQVVGSVSTTRFLKDSMKKQNKKRMLGRQNIIINMIRPEFIGSPSLVGSEVNFMDSKENSVNKNNDLKTIFVSINARSELERLAILARLLVARNRFRGWLDGLQVINYPVAFITGIMELPLKAIGGLLSYPFHEASKKKSVIGMIAAAIPLAVGQLFFAAGNILGYARRLVDTACNFVSSGLAWCADKFRKKKIYGTRYPTLGLNLSRLAINGLPLLAYGGAIALCTLPGGQIAPAIVAALGSSSSATAAFMGMSVGASVAAQAAIGWGAYAINKIKHIFKRKKEKTVEKIKRKIKKPVKISTRPVLDAVYRAQNRDMHIALSPEPSVIKTRSRSLSIDASLETDNAISPSIEPVLPVIKIPESGVIAPEDVILQEKTTVASAHQEPNVIKPRSRSLSVDVSLEADNSVPPIEEPVLSVVKPSVSVAIAPADIILREKMIFTSALFNQKDPGNRYAVYSLPGEQKAYATLHADTHTSLKKAVVNLKPGHAQYNTLTKNDEEIAWVNHWKEGANGNQQLVSEVTEISDALIPAQIFSQNFSEDFLRSLQAKNNLTSGIHPLTQKSLATVFEGYMLKLKNNQELVSAASMENFLVEKLNIHMEIASLLKREVVKLVQLYEKAFSSNMIASLVKKQVDSIVGNNKKCTVVIPRAWDPLYVKAAILYCTAKKYSYVNRSGYALPEPTGAEVKEFNKILKNLPKNEVVAANMSRVNYPTF